MKKLLLLLLTLLTFDYAAADQSITSDGITYNYAAGDKYITIDGITYRIPYASTATVIAINDNLLDEEITIPAKIPGSYVSGIGDELLKNKTFNSITFECTLYHFGKDAFANASGTIHFKSNNSTNNYDESPFNNFNGKILFSYSYINVQDLFSFFKNCYAPNLTIFVSEKKYDEFLSCFNENPSFKTAPINQAEEVEISDVKHDLDVLTFNVTYRSDIDVTKIILKKITVDNVPVKEYDGVYKIEGLMLGQKHVIEVTYIRPNGKSATINKESTMYDVYAYNTDDNCKNYQGKLEINCCVCYNSDFADAFFSKDSGYAFFYYSEKQDKYYEGILEPADSYTKRIFTGVIDGLFPNTYYNIYFVIKKGDKVIYSKKLDSFHTAELNCDYEYKSTQTTITLSKIELLLDGTYNPGEIEYFNDNIKINSFPYKLTGLKPDDSRGFSVKNKDGKELCQFSINTLSLDAYPTNAGYGYDHSEGRNHYSSYQPTTYIFKPYAGKNDCDIESYHFYGELFGNKTVTCKPGEQLVATGLKPGGKNRFEFWVTLKNDNSSKKYSYSKNYIYTTGDLKLVTLQPRNVSATSSIVCAETNISDRETNVGFQWRKYDAPESLKSSEGYAAIYDGLMEGRINKLQSTSYYKVRAFYKSNSGEYYYGDWVTFDPSDFSYFEPTVHTYNIDYVTYNSAEVRGYVMAGSDEIIRQGFEYSATTSQAAPKRKYVAATQNPTIILATGQVMTATLTDLKPSTTYTIRAFAETASGIVYGDEQVFTTDAFSGISDAIAEKDGRTPTAYYDLSGRRYDKPQHGVNIVVYDDGTVEKMLIKQQ